MAFNRHAGATLKLPLFVVVNAVIFCIVNYPASCGKPIRSLRGSFRTVRSPVHNTFGQHNIMVPRTHTTWESTPTTFKFRSATATRRAAPLGRERMATDTQ